MDERNAVGAGDSLILDVKRFEAELRLHSVSYALADSEGIANGFAVSVEIGERHRAFTVAKSN